MICYSLTCSENLTFDSWFSNAAAYAKLKEQGFLSCTVCGTVKVEKAVMAPNVSSKSKPENKKMQKLSPSPAEKAIAELKNYVQQNFHYR